MCSALIILSSTPKMSLLNWPGYQTYQTYAQGLRIYGDSMGIHLSYLKCGTKVNYHFKFNTKTGTTTLFIFHHLRSAWTCSVKSCCLHALMNLCICCVCGNLTFKEEYFCIPDLVCDFVSLGRLMLDTIPEICFYRWNRQTLLPPVCQGASVRCISLH